MLDEDVKGVMKFSDRRKSNKFKRDIINEEVLWKYVEGFDNLKDMFRFYSEADE